MGAVHRALLALEAPKHVYDNPPEPEEEPPSSTSSRQRPGVRPSEALKQRVVQGEFDDSPSSDVDEEGEVPRTVGEGPGLTIAADFIFPLDVVTQSIGIVAARGSGKTYLTTVMAEELTWAELPFVIIDPVGVYWGMRSSSNGQDPGLQVIILGGDHGDAPLDPGVGRAIARWLLEYHKPTILDISLMRKAEQRNFVADFAEELYAISRSPMHIIVDEADLFIPQRASPEEKRVLNAFEDIVRRGRVRGLGITVVSQRPAVLHKDILTQIGTLIVLRMGGPQDRKAIEDWIKFHGDPYKQRLVLSSLASLPIGSAWVWSPGWLGVLKRIAVRKKFTFDSSATPTAGGDLPTVPDYVTDVDADAVKQSLADAISHDPNDPQVLKARIAELEKALSEGTDGAGSVVGKLQKRVAELEKLLLARAPKVKGAFFDPIEFVVQMERLTEAVAKLTLNSATSIEESSAPAPSAKGKKR